MSHSSHHEGRQGGSPVRFPEMRAEAVGAVRALSDRAYQDRVWIRRELPTPTFMDGLDLNVHILFDDTRVLPDPTPVVGVVIHADEVESLQALGDVLALLIDDLGDVPDADYLADPRWAQVVDAAVAALAAMSPRAGGEAAGAR